MAGADLQILIRARDNASRVLGQVAKNAQTTSQRLGNVSKSLTSVGRGAGIAAGIGVGAIGLMAKSAAEFDNAFREVNTLVGMSEQELAGMRDQVKGLSLDMGVDAVEQTKAMYQAISAGVPAENAFQFLQDAAKLGIAGVASTEEAVSALTGVMNAFQTESLTAAEASDVLFTTVRLGKTQMAELPRAFGMAAPAAAAAGVSFRETAAALASVTKIIPNVNTAASSLRQVFAEADKTGTKFNKALRELGVETMAQATQKFGSFQATLQKVYEATGDSDVAFKNLFGSVEGANAALTLVGSNAATAAKDLEGMNNAAGAANTAFAEMEKSSSRDFAKAQQVIQNLRLEMGEALMPTLVSVMSGFRDILTPVIEWIKRNPELTKTIGMIVVVVVGLTAALAAVSFAAGAATGAIAFATGAFGFLAGAVGATAGAFAALNLVTGGLIIAIGAVIAAVILMATHWQETKRIFVTVANVVLTAVEFMAQKIVDAINWVIRQINKVAGIFGKSIGEIADVHLPRLKQAVEEAAIFVVTAEELQAEAVRELERQVASSMTGIVEHHREMAAEVTKIAQDLSTTGHQVMAIRAEAELKFTEDTSARKLEQIKGANALVLEEQRAAVAEAELITREAAEAEAKAAAAREEAQIGRITAFEDQMHADRLARQKKADDEAIALMEDVRKAYLKVEEDKEQAALRRRQAEKDLAADEQARLRVLVNRGRAVYTGMTAAQENRAAAFAALSKGGGKLRNALGELIGAAAANLIDATAAAPGIMGVPAIPGFQTGGIVPGARGQPRLIVAHGGERVVPQGQGGVTIILPNYIGSKRDLQDVLVKGLVEAERQGRVKAGTTR